MVHLLVSHRLDSSATLDLIANAVDSQDPPDLSACAVDSPDTPDLCADTVDSPDAAHLSPDINGNGSDGSNLPQIQENNGDQAHLTLCATSTPHSAATDRDLALASLSHPHTHTLSPSLFSLPIKHTQTAGTVLNISMMIRLRKQLKTSSCNIVGFSCHSNCNISHHHIITLSLLYRL